MTSGLPDFTRAMAINVTVDTQQVLKLSTTQTNKQVSVGLTEEQLLAADTTRIAVGLVTDTQATVYIGATGLTTATGFYLPPNVVIMMTGYTGALYAIATSAGQNVYVMEFK